MEDLKTKEFISKDELLEFVNTNKAIVKAIVKEQYWILFYKKYED
jgi:hypothetical protein